MQPESLQFRSINTFLFHNNMQSPNNMSQTITLSQFSVKVSTGPAQRKKGAQKRLCKHLFFAKSESIFNQI